MDSLVSIYRRTLACLRRSDIAEGSEVRQGWGQEEERERERVGNVALTSYNSLAVFHAHIYLRRRPHDRNAWNRLGELGLQF